jgi:hypothetical protein
VIARFAEESTTMRFDMTQKIASFHMGVSSNGSRVTFRPFNSCSASSRLA